MQERHTGDNIHAALHDIETEFGIADKIAGLTSDNASNMVVAASKHVFCTPGHAYVNCFAHTLQLAVNDGLGLQPIKDAVLSARKLVSHFHRSTLSTGNLETYQRNHEEKNTKLIQDVRPRNSTRIYSRKNSRMI